MSCVTKEGVKNLPITPRNDPGGTRPRANPCPQGRIDPGVPPVDQSKSRKHAPPRVRIGQGKTPRIGAPGHE
eukprot:scaffold516_cov307-Pavlova_lutheri.AAC.7